MNKYRISKYNPEYRDSEGRFIKDEWTSFSDIGKIFDSKVFTVNQYLDVEAAYCKTIMLILQECNINDMVIDKLEIYYSAREIKKLLKAKDLDCAGLSRKDISSLKNGVKIREDFFEKLLKLLLREFLWCELKDENSHIKIEFGYDL